MIEFSGEPESWGWAEIYGPLFEISLRKRSFEPSLGEKGSEIVQKKCGFLQKVAGAVPKGVSKESDFFGTESHIFI